MENNSWTEIIRDVTFFWVKMGKPVNPFGEERWEVQIRFPKSRVKEMEKYGKVKPSDDGLFQLNLIKRAIKSDGSPAKQPECLDGFKNALDPMIVGNGSKGNVQVLMRNYEIKGPKGNVIKSGTAVSLNKIQVTALKRYEPKSVDDFDEVGMEEINDDEDENNTPEPTPTPKPAEKPAKPVAKRGRPAKAPVVDSDF